MKSANFFLPVFVSEIFDGYPVSFWIRIQKSDGFRDNFGENSTYFLFQEF